MTLQDCQTDAAWADALRREDFASAWEITDRHLRAAETFAPPKHSGERHRQRIWRGEPLEGRRVLVRCYHGLGDTIQFARFLKPLRAIAHYVVLWCQPELLALLANMSEIDEVLPLHDGTPEVEYDVDIEVMELAHALRADAGMVAANIPYLHAFADQPHPRSTVPGILSVGLVWEAGAWDPRRSVPVEALAPLGAVPGIRLVSLQQGHGRGSVGRIPAEDIAADTIGALAATIQQLDLVITVDTMVAHLAGALGAPVWTMLHRDCDWRWPVSGSGSIWYPTMRLFHQRHAGDWGCVIDDFVEELRKLTSSTRHEAKC